MTQFWDERNWQLSLQSDNPVETYNKSVSERKSLANTPKVDDLPAHEQAWLRAT